MTVRWTPDIESGSEAQCAGHGPACGERRNGSARGTGSQSKSPNMVLAANENHAVGDRRRGHAGFRHRIDGKQVELWTRLDHETAVLLACEIQPAVGGDRRCREAAVCLKTFLVNLLACLCVDTGH